MTVDYEKTKYQLQNEIKIYNLDDQIIDIESPNTSPKNKIQLN